jgi:iron complex transport system substrate-binding protein
MPEKHRKTVRWKWALAVCICGMCWVGASTVQSQPHAVNVISQTRSVIDMAGRQVTIPRNVLRVATVGSVPVINSYLCALGEGRRIVNGLPRFARTKRFRLQTAIAPHLARQPVLQGQNYAVNTEVLLRLRPDVVITMSSDAFAAKALESIGIPVIFLEWRDSSDVKANMKLLGDVLDCAPKCDRYLKYFDAAISRVRRALNGVSKESRPKVLFFDPNTLTTPLLIADWWIKEAGGVSVTAGVSRLDNIGISYSYEQILKWDPDILIVSAPEQIARLYQDKRLSTVKAVLNRKVFVIPFGAHPWGHRTAEQPLTVLWAAKLFHPGRFEQVSMEDEVRAFYRDFFDHELSDRDIREILMGGVE